MIYFLVTRSDSSEADHRRASLRLGLGKARHVNRSAASEPIEAKEAEKSSCVFHEARASFGEAAQGS